MTIEELSVRISADAEEALNMLDLVTQRLSALDELLNHQIRIGLDGELTSASFQLLEEQMAALQERLSLQSQDMAATIQGMMSSLSDGFAQLAEGAVADSAASIQHGLRSAAEAADQAGDAAHDAAARLDQLGNAQRNANRQAQTYRSTLGGLDSRLDQLGRQRSAVSNVKDLGRQMQEGSQSAGRMQGALRTTERGIQSGIRAAKNMGDSFRSMGDNFDRSGDVITVNAQQLYGQLGGVIAWAQNAADSLEISGSVQVDTSGAVSALNNLIQVAMAAQSILAGLGVATGSAGEAVKVGGGGGGGGGGKKSAQQEAEEAARAAEEARKEALEQDYAVIEHKRHMNQITLEEEIALLRQIRGKHQLNAEEIMEWEERIFDVQKEIRQRDAESLDRLSEGVVEALTEKYEAMRDAELQRVEESRRAWETWRDDSVRAIEDQIDALDRLAQAEDREDQDAEELRRIEMLKRDIAYEQDEFNRKKLEEQLRQAVEEREKRLRRQELEDQKEALRQQAEEVELRAQQEMDKLDVEEAAIEKLYEKRLDAAALEAEAEKLIMENSQQEILALLNAYVPEYDLLGRTMGERLLSGFQNTVGNVVSWFGQLSKQVDNVWTGLVNTAGQAVPHMGSQTGAGTSSPPEVNIVQNVSFNQPVESPGDVARRMESVNQALGEWMSQEG
ncbi:MAG: hypothetical protein J6K73_08565 [Clostridia bacterium]|nr:hypothetical protein [Clostridia bacterium]